MHDLYNVWCIPKKGVTQLNQKKEHMWKDGPFHSDRKGSMKLPLSVCQSVNSSINTFSPKWLIWFFWVFSKNFYKIEDVASSASCLIRFQDSLIIKSLERIN